MKLKTAKLGEICQIGDGAHASLKREKKGIPYLTAKNVTKHGIDYSSLDYISESTYLKHFKGNTSALTQPQKNDILYSIIGSNIGGVCLVGDEKIGVSSSVAIFRCREKFYPQYIYYFFKSEYFDLQIQSIKGGAAQNFMSLKKLGDVMISYPEYETQRRIASILSAYDDLIENNQKQIKLLEEAAQRLYKEWFVDLRFPGYENVKVVDGVPEGWKKEKLEDVITYEIGGGWGEEEKTSDSENEAFVIRGTDFYGLTHGELLSIPFRYHKASNLSSRKLQHGDIIFEVSGGSKTEGVARTALITQSMLDNWKNSVMCASFCKLVRTDIKYSQFMFNHFIYLRQSGKTSEYDKKSASSIVNYRWKDFLSQELVLLPSNSILDKYNALAESVYSKIVACSLQIEKAKQARDRLLPKLMSGELEV